MNFCNSSNSSSSKENGELMSADIKEWALPRTQKSEKRAKAFTPVVNQTVGNARVHANLNSTSGSDRGTRVPRE